MTSRDEGLVWLLLGLLVVLAYQGGSVLVNAVGGSVQSIADKLAYAIAFAEGFFTAGSRPQRNHNPGDLETDITGAGVGFDGPYVIYGSDSDGWAALTQQANLMFGGSHVYNPSMTISQVAFHYADGTDDPQGAADWASNVASKLGVTVDTTLSELS